MSLVLWEQLKKEIATYGPSVVAFSGGVDSTLLLAAAVEALGKEKIAAVTAVSGTYTKEEQERAIRITTELGVAHVIFSSDEFSDPLFVRNESDRCYHCKKNRFLSLIGWAKENGFEGIIEGTHAEDLGDFRPGLKAIAELNEEFFGMIKSPLKELGWGKKEIRTVSKEQGLVTWDLPSAACLASRIAYGIPLDEEKLELVGEVETFLKQWIEGPLRFRHHGTWARIEVEPKDWVKITDLSTAQQIVEKVKFYGFDYVTLDLAGLKSGSMNTGVSKE